MDLKTRILIAMQKDSVYPSEDIYAPILVGANLLNTNNLRGWRYGADNEGVNISSKNRFYCELTAIYWAWKNLKDVDVIGLCHYRRYLDYHKQCRPYFSTTSFTEAELEKLNMSVDNKTLQMVKSGSVVVPKAQKMPCTNQHNYCEYHIGDDYKTLESIVEQTQNGAYKQAFVEVSNDNKLYPYNMFLMRWDDFDGYCSWLFPLLEEVEEKIDISHYTPYQQRVYGFMAERLFNVWLRAERKNLIEKPVIFIEEGNVQNKIYGPRKLIKEMRKDICSKLINALYRHRLKI